MFQCGQEILIQRPVRTMHRMATTTLHQEPSALLYRIRQFDERIGQLDATDK